MADEQKVLADLKVTYPIEGAKQFAASLKEVDEAIKSLKQNTKDLDKQLSGIFKDATQTVKQVASQASKGMVNDLERQLARLDASLTSLGSRAKQIGVKIPGLQDYQEVIRTMRDANLTAKDLSKSQQEAVIGAQRFADIHSQNLKVIESEANLLRDKKHLEDMGADTAKRTLLATQQATQQQQKSLLEMELSLERTNSQLSAMEMRLRGRGELDSPIGQKLIQHKEEIQAILEKIRLNKELTAEEREQAKALTTNANIVKEQARQLEAESKKVERTSETFWERRMGWFIAGTAFYGSMKAFKDTLKTIGDVEMGMVEIARVTNDATFSMGKMRDELLQIGKDYGTQFDQVQQIALRWAQSGYNVADTLELTKNSLLALNTAELNVEQATSGLIAIMAQWNLEASDLLPTIDKISKAADNYAITATDLVAGLTRASGAAKVLGMSLEETIAVLTVMREATGRTGKEVGNALNSILSFIQRTKTIELFESEGIQVWADEAQTSFRNVIDIFDDMAARWPQMTKATQDMFVDSAQAAGLYSEELAELAGATQEFTDAQQRDLSQATAGIYRRNYLLALLQNWGRINDVLLVQEDSLGYSMSKNEQAMSTYQKQVEQLGVEITQLQVALGDSGLLGIMKLLVRGGTAALDLIGKFPPEIQSLVVNVGALTTGLLALQAVLRTFSGAQLIKAGGAIAEQIAAATAGLTGLSKALATVGVFFKANAIALSLIAIVGTLMTINNQIKRTNEEMIEQSKTASGLLDDYRKAEEQLSKLTEGTEEYNRALDRMARIRREIVASSVPGVVADGRIDISALERAAETFRKTQKEIATTNTELQEYHDRINAITKEIDTLERQKELVSGLAERHKELAKAAQGADEEEVTKAKKDLIRVEESLIQIIGEDGLARLKAANYAEEAINLEIKKIDELITARRESTREQKEKERELTQELIQETRRRLQAYTTEMMAMRERVDALQDQYKMRAFLDPDQRGELKKTLATAEEVFQHYKDKAEGAAQYLEELQGNLGRLNKETEDNYVKTGNAAGGIGKLTDAIREFIEAIKSASDSIGLYNAELQRMVDLTQARVDYFGREKAGYDQQIRAAKEQSDILSLLREKQKGIHEEAEKVREAVTKLESRQKTLNRSTDDGKKAFADLGNEIESLKRKATELGIEYWKLQQIIDDTGLSTEELIRKSRGRRISAQQTQYEYLKGLGTSEGWMGAELLKPQLIRDMDLQISDLRQQSIDVTLEIARLYQEVNNLNPAIQEEADLIRTNNALIDAWEQKQSDLRSQIHDTESAISELNSEINVLGGHAVEMVNSIQDSVKRGLISLEQALDLLDTLERRAGSFDSLTRLRGELLAQQWTDMLERELERAKRIYERNIKDLDDQIDRVNKRAEAQIESLNNRITATKEALEEELKVFQAMLDALEEEEKQDEREKATEEHNRKMKELNDNRTWYILKGEEEYAFEIAAIDKAVAEEQKRWSEQLKKWQIEDEKERIRGLMDAAKERAKAREQELKEQIDHTKKQRDIQIEALRDEKQRLKEHWDDKEEGIRAIMRKGLINTIADMAAQDPKFMERGQAVMDNLIAGIRSKKSDLEAEVAAINRLIAQIQRAEAQRIEKQIRSGGSSGGGSKSKDDDVISRSQALLDAKREYERAEARGDEAGKEAARKKGEQIRSSGPTLDPGNTKTGDQLEKEIKDKKKYALGAYMIGPVREVRGKTLHEYGEAGKEIILPLSRAIPVLSESLMIAIKNLQTPEPRLDGIERALLQGFNNLGGKIPKQITVIAEIDGEAVATKTIPLLGKAIRQSARRR